MVHTTQTDQIGIGTALDGDPKAAVRRLAARKADPHLPSPQSDASHDDDKPSGSGG